MGETVVHVGEQIIRARKRCGMTQIELARRLGARFLTEPERMRRNLANWEGLRNTPRHRYLEAIAAETGQTLDFFRVQPVTVEEVAPVGDTFRTADGNSRDADPGAPGVQDPDADVNGSAA